MQNSDVQKLIQLRQYIIERYGSLDAKDTNLAVTPTKEVALTYESIIRSIEDILAAHVTITRQIEKKEYLVHVCLDMQ